MANDAQNNALFDLDSVFEVDDYLFAYGGSLTPERSAAEVAMVARLLQLDAPLRILDLACGFGRHANRLAELGHGVTGIDYMPGFLDIARKEAARMGVTVDYQQGDMRHLRFANEFDLVLSLFTSFGYFDDSGNERAVGNMARALKPGGRLLLDIPNRDGFMRNLPPTLVYDINGDLLIDRITFDVVTGRSCNQRIVIRSGIRRDKPFHMRLYSATEISQLLHRAGLADLKLFGENEQPLTLTSRRMLVVAQKPSSPIPNQSLRLL